MIANLQLAVLYGAPALVLWLLLWRGRYPGEKLVGRLAAVRRPRRLRPLPFVAPPRPAPPRIAGGRLLARRLAGRAPPAVVVL